MAYSSPCATTDPAILAPQAKPPGPQKSSPSLKIISVFLLSVQKSLSIDARTLAACTMPSNNPPQHTNKSTQESIGAVLHFLRRSFNRIGFVFIGIIIEWQNHSFGLLFENSCCHAINLSISFSISSGDGISIGVSIDWLCSKHEYLVIKSSIISQSSFTIRVRF